MFKEIGLAASMLKNFWNFIIQQLLAPLLDKFGGVLLSKRVYKNLIQQRDSACDDLIKVELLKHKRGISIVVFSKDRAIQLHAFIRSYANNVEGNYPVQVIYFTSSEKHQKSYDELNHYCINKKLNINFIRERNSFKETLLGVLETIDMSNIVFFVDDIIFLNSLDIEQLNSIDSQSYILSLRHSPYLRKNYTANIDQLPPKLYPSNLSRDLLEFKWFMAGNEWSDPWSLDGQVLSTAEVKILTRISEFFGPNTYEAALKSFGYLAKKKAGLCYKNSKIMNMPINRVQTEYHNRSGQVSVDFLLGQWNSGLAIDIKRFAGYIPQAPHEEHELIFEKRL